ncbi:cyclic GMP-AMP synthase-like receptor 2 [Argopecten irradians]|uniref:cyclic GMP-AMP synthase-like receptor 2 n=1 Tax=Argopecten irradians TaxID=31199 RepID=UPI0037154E1B
MAAPGDKYPEHEETHQEESLAISATLDAIGFNAEIIKLTRTSIPQSIEIFSIIKGVETVGIETRLIGSAGEGLLTLTLNSGTTSDIDYIKILLDYEVHEDNDTCVEQDHFQFWIESCETNAGYVKLRIANDKTLRQLESSFVEYDAERNIHYLTNAAVIMSSEQNITSDMQCAVDKMRDTFIMMDHIVCGPSCSSVYRENFKPDTFGIDKIDVVISIPSPKWPSVAEEWIKRKRNYGWPSRDFISEHEKQGCYVVPVGCKECDRTHLDWRLSFVLVEQALVWDFNSTQLQCFGLLKHLKKFVFEKEIGDIISSYILKTIVFWVIEESPPKLWVPHRLLTAVQVCLDRLIECVQDNCCPNYFVRACNLLTNRYSTTEKPIVLRACYFVRKDTVRLLTQTQLFNNALECYRFHRSTIESAMNILITNSGRLFLCITEVMKLNHVVILQKYHPVKNL